MNRQERRAQNARMKKTQTKVLRLNDETDIQIDGKGSQVVMIMGNAAGRALVDRLWPGAQWSRDETFAQFKPADWSFTHVRVLRVPPQVEAGVPLAAASADSVGMVVAAVCQSHLPPRRVAQFVGSPPDVRITFYEGPTIAAGGERSVEVEHLPPGSPIGPRVASG